MSRATAKENVVEDSLVVDAEVAANARTHRAPRLLRAAEVVDKLEEAVCGRRCAHVKHARVDLVLGIVELHYKRCGERAYEGPRVGQPRRVRIREEDVVPG